MLQTPTFPKLEITVQSLKVADPLKQWNAGLSQRMTKTSSAMSEFNSDVAHFVHGAVA